jgi:hypothetical protein
MERLFYYRGSRRPLHEQSPWSLPLSQAVLAKRKPALPGLMPLLRSVGRGSCPLHEQSPWSLPLSQAVLAKRKPALPGLIPISLYTLSLPVWVVIKEIIYMV